MVEIRFSRNEHSFKVVVSNNRILLFHFLRGNYALLGGASYRLEGQTIHVTGGFTIRPERFGVENFEGLKQALRRRVIAAVRKKHPEAGKFEGYLFDTHAMDTIKAQDALGFPRPARERRKARVA